MKTFHFPLEKALDWRRIELELEEASFKQQAADSPNSTAPRARSKPRHPRRDRGPRMEPGGRRRSVALGELPPSRESRGGGDRRAAARSAPKSWPRSRSSMLEARRRCRLLERLKERRLAEWTAARDQELEEMAAESLPGALARSNSRDRCPIHIMTR